MIKKTARKNIGNVKSVNGFEPDDAGDVAFEYVKSVNGFEPDATGNVTMETSSQVVLYVDVGESPYLYKDDSLTTKITKSELVSLVKEGKNSIVVSPAPSALPNSSWVIIQYPFGIQATDDDYATILMFAGDGLLFYYTAEYVVEEDS